MRWTAMGAAWVIGVCLVQQLPYLPTTGTRLLLVASVAVLCLLAIQVLRVRSWGLVLAVVCLAVLWVSWRADIRLGHGLSLSEDNRVTRVVLEVSAMAQQLDGGVRFIATLQPPVPPNMPRRVLVDWSGACASGCADSVFPGQHWRMALRLRRPHGRLNIHGFDTQAWLFAQDVRATAVVRGKPERLANPANSHAGLWVEQLRQRIRERMLRLLVGKREAPVMVALAIGDQQGVSAQDWQVFSLTGITHLVSISGSHVTLIAGLGGGLLALLWRFSGCQRLARRTVFIWGSVLVAWLYCLLAGWGVPAQRTFFMLVFAALALSLKIPVTGLQAVLLAGVTMTVIDPWCVLSTGFWLSFGAMLILILIAQRALDQINGDETRAKWSLTVLLSAAHLQLVMTLATVPVLAYLFQMVSAASLPANAWAIPTITFIATPLALVFSASCLLPVSDAWIKPIAWLAHEALVWSLAPVRWLANYPQLSWEVAAMPFVYLVFALAGVVLALMVSSSPWRYVGWLFMVPGLLYTPATPSEGAWSLVAFDIGQGGAVLVRTRSRAVLFDTGWRFGEIDAVTRVVLPELRAMGIKHVDHVVISHPDMDHLGGLDSLKAARSIGSLHGSGLGRQQALACRAGQRWEFDGVTFEFVYPSDDCATRELRGELRNRCSCVLRVRGAWHSALLTGDIDHEAERSLVKMGVSPVDIVMMPHHGSATGSSLGFIKALKARHAIAQTGHHNRFGHPDASVIKRWQTNGARTWVSAHDGAIVVESTPAGLSVQSSRESRKRYWHDSTERSIENVQPAP
jgi:competence protein ComEC